MGLVEVARATGEVGRVESTRIMLSISAGGAPYNVRSKASSLNPSTAAQVSAVARARPTTDVTAPGLTPRLLAVSRWLRCATDFSRRISRIFRIGTRSVAIRSLTPPWDKERIVEPMPSVAHGDHDPWNG
jgi:hypothetical protein